VPVQVVGLTNVAAVAAGYYHGVALKADGTVWAWGDNGSGRLGDGTNTNRSLAVQVVGLTDVVAIAAGENHTLALKADGTLWAWGYNGQGQLGEGSGTERRTPVRVYGLTNVVAIDGGQYHSLALKADNTVWAWGYNNYGQLGRNNTTGSSTPVQVMTDVGLTTPLTGVVAIAAGDNYSVAAKSDGTVWAWGYNGYGQLGDGTTANQLLPVAVTGLTGVVQEISAGRNHTLAQRTDGTLFAWGDNGNGRLGTGTVVDSSSPMQVLVAGGLGVVNVSSNLVSVLISGPVAVAEVSATATYTAMATLNDGTSASVTPSWSVAGLAGASIDAAGVLTVPAVSVAAGASSGGGPTHRAG